MGRKTEVQQSANKNFNFCQAFCAPVKVAPMCGGQNMAPHVKKWLPLDGAHE